MFLLKSPREIIIFALICLLVFALHVGLEFHKFTQFKALEFQNINAVLLKSEQKISKNSKVFYNNYFKADDFSFYARSKKELKNATYSLKISTKSIKFKHFLKGSFFTTFRDLKQIPTPNSLKNTLKELIYAQHEHKLMRELYAALYLALPMSSELRNSVTNWGIAHLIAISGFHLSLLFAVFYFLLKRPYMALQSRFFPYRNKEIDLGFFILLLAGFYLWLLDFTPSFFRSYLMAILAFFLLVRGLKIFAFGNIILCVLIALCLDPALLFSVGFYFSALGVFFIITYIHHFGERSHLKDWRKVACHLVFFEFYVFCAMNIPVYYFFSQASIFQLSVIPLGYAFCVFYPLSIVLHLFGFGSFFDGFLLDFFASASKGADIFIPAWLFWLFNLSLPLIAYFRIIAIFFALLGAGIYFYNLL